MSMWKSEVSDLILKSTVSPTLTLWRVAKPWIEGSPAPVKFHSPGDVPGLEFSQATGFAGGEQGSSASARDVAGRIARSPKTAPSRAIPARRERRAGAPGTGACLRGRIVISHTTVLARPNSRGPYVRK